MPMPMQQGKAVHVPIMEITRNDVIGGCSALARNHPGNVRYRDMASNAILDKLKTLNANETRVIAETIMQNITTADPPGRFLKQTNKSKSNKGLWYEMGYSEALRKTIKMVQKRHWTMTKDEEVNETTCINTHDSARKQTRTHTLSDVKLVNDKTSSQFPADDRVYSHLDASVTHDQEEFTHTTRKRTRTRRRAAEESMADETPGTFDQHLPASPNTSSVVIREEETEELVSVEEPKMKKTQRRTVHLQTPANSLGRRYTYPIESHTSDDDDDDVDGDMNMDKEEEEDQEEREDPPQEKKKTDDSSHHWMAASTLDGNVYV